MNRLVKILAGAFAALCAAAAFAAVDVNKASQAELETIKGIGPAMSTRIVDARKTGAFKDWSDLSTRVKGIGDGNAKKFSADGMTVNGASFAPGAAPEKAPAKGAGKASGKVAKADPAPHAAK
jgi:competence protein ComEA